VLFVTNDRCVEHTAGEMHPESPQRLRAVFAALDRADLREAVTLVEAPKAPLELLAGVHTQDLVDMIQAVSARGGGRIDMDTVVAPASFDAARYAAGAGLESIERLGRGEADTAFCAVRPPGHHATKAESMGFCLFNNVAVAATALADAGERVLIVDYDAHHGNGTQDIFYDDPRVLFVSFHQWPCYPGTGRIDESGRGNGTGTTINVPLPPGTTGDVYNQAWDRHVAPHVDAFEPTWVLISAGFDAHQADPITDMGLTAGDYALLTSRILEIAPAGRRVVFLEGGYDLTALTESAAAVMATIVGQSFDTERPTNGGPGVEIIDKAIDHFGTLS
jgi:acetoin utilization deacetylase AcuC-like enzyme